MYGLAYFLKSAKYAAKYFMYYWGALIQYAGTTPLTFKDQISQVTMKVGRRIVLREKL